MLIWGRNANGNEIKEKGCIKQNFFQIIFMLKGNIYFRRQLSWRRIQILRTRAPMQTTRRTAIPRTAIPRTAIPRTAILRTAVLRIAVLRIAAPRTAPRTAVLPISPATRAEATAITKRRRRKRFSADDALTRCKNQSISYDGYRNRLQEPPAICFFI